MTRLKEQVAMVTGGASGIGAAIVKRLTSEGARIAIADINDMQGQERAEEVDGWFSHCDVGSYPEVQAAVDQVLAKFGGVDILVCAAALTGDHLDAASITVESWHRGLEVSLSGALYAGKSVLPIMIQRGGGAIVHISSVEGVMGATSHAAYVTAKRGLLGLTESMAIDFGRHGIRVNAISPGIIDTDRPDIQQGKRNPEQMRFWRDMTVLGRLGYPEEIASVAAFLVSCDASYLTGQNIIVDGGWTIGHPPLPTGAT